MRLAGRWRMWLHVAQVLATIGLVGLVLARVRWSELTPLLRDLSPGLLLLSVSLVLLSHLINVMRWQYFVQQPAATYDKLLIWYGAGLFSNNFLPSGIGGDGVRAALLSRAVPLAQAVVSVGLERLISLLALSALLVAGLWLGVPPGFALDQQALASLERSGALLAGLALLLGVLLWLAQRQLAPLRFRVRQVLRRWLAGAAALPVPLHTRLRLIGAGYLLSVLSHLSIAAAYWALLLALGLNIAYGAPVWLVLVGAAASLLPIAVNGLGVQENAFVLLLGCYGVSTTAALAVALLIRMLMVGFSLAGGLLTLVEQPIQLRLKKS